MNVSSHRIIENYYERHYSDLYTFVNIRIQDPDEAKDIVQNVFMRLLSCNKMITTVTLPNLVYTIARNLICDYWRHKRSVHEYVYYINKSANREYSLYSVWEIEEMLQKGIARLTDKQRIVYVMNVYQGMKVSEISDTLRDNYKNVESRLGIARKEIRQFMHKMLA
ncbi:MAG: sigma-70 family RNA polymerase sigma factor [Prevotella sp.]|nr:sigma-70 family RNA polymerase sigma factor [Prevotella sp.]MBQ5605968.1 sigma-70 family RNA polymerase sigma factor [Prevotella sp.]